MNASIDPSLLGLETDYLTAFAMRRLGDREAARDAVQDTFLAALSAPRAFAGSSSLRTWLTGILKHKIADSFRDPGRQAASYEDARDAIESIALPTSEQPEERLESARLMALADRQLSRMPKRAAQVFLMTEIGGESDESVANSLGVSSDNVSVMRFRARRSLRAALAPAMAIR